VSGPDGPRIEPCRDDQALRRYIDEHWRRGHVLARDDAMFRFTYMTPWVDARVFPAGISVLTITDGARILGFLGAICAPYPRATAYWLALWHVLPELKGGGVGGKLLLRMQEIALTGGGREPYGRTGWIGTFGAGPEALPVYLKRGYVVRSARRWVYDADAVDANALMPEPTPSTVGEVGPGEEWLRFRFAEHPAYRYERSDDPAAAGTVFRSEDNAWGRVTHAARLSGDHRAATRRVFERERRAAGDRPYLMDAWAFTCPGPGWSLAAEVVPSVFHPPQARGNVINAVGLPFLPRQVHKGDCDQDRPN
jgi:hypothetical protein